MIGILTEKPSAARHMADALGGMSGTYNGESYCIANLAGHLYEFAKPGVQVPDYKSWGLESLPWDASRIPWKRVMTEGSSGLLKTMKSAFSQCSEIVIATDDDPTGEGDLLAWEALDGMGVHAAKFSRMSFDSETPPVLQKAFVSRKPISSRALDNPAYKMAYYRTRFDFLTMQFTRVSVACGDGKSVLRQGRLKSAMVVLVGDALAAVKAYKKIPYYQNRFRDENGNVYTNSAEQMYPDKAQVPKTYRASAVIVDSKTLKKSAPPKFLNLSTLASALAPRGISAASVLSTYQRMYEAQVVSYPRTEDKCITSEQFDELLPYVDAIAGVVGVNVALLTHRTPRATHIASGCAHGANRPGKNVPASLDSLKQYGACAPAIYELLAKNYLATLAEDYVYEHQAGHVEAYPAFKGTANVPVKQGYKAVYSDVTADDDSDDVSVKGLGTQAKPFVHEGFPPKPPMPSMKWLMNQLEKRSVGTGATQTSTYSDVTSKKAKFPLLSDSRGKISMTNYGEMSYMLLKGTKIGDLSLTEKVWQNMKDVRDGKADADALLSEVAPMVLHDIEVMKRNGEVMRKELHIMDGSVDKEVYSGYMSGLGKDVTFNRVFAQHRFTDEECEQLLAGDEVSCTDFVKATGEQFAAKGALAEQTYNGHAYVGFKISKFLNADGSEVNEVERVEGMFKGKKKVSFKRVWSGHRFTDQECEQLLAGGEISFDAKSKAGNNYTATGKLAEQTYNGRKFFGFKLKPREK